MFRALFLAAALLLLGLFKFSTAEAQYVPYQMVTCPTLTPGSTLELLDGGVHVISGKADANGRVFASIITTGVLKPGDRVTFTLNGQPVKESFIFTVGGMSPPPCQSITLVTAAAPIVTSALSTFTPITPTFSSSGVALVVFSGGSIAQLEQTARGASATGVWAQDGAGAYQLWVIDGPTFINAAFQRAFSMGLPTKAVTLIR